MDKQHPLITVRKLSEADAHPLEQIGRATFIEAFQHNNSELSMRQYLEEGFAPGKVLAELQHSESQFYFAESGGQPIGYLKVNWGSAQNESMLEDALEIERIYVLEAFHRKGVGATLLEKALAIALQQAAKVVWLGVWEYNPKAIRFYEKYDFRIFSEHVFQLGDEAQTDLLMKRKL